jgi:hypothetical protein
VISGHPTGKALGKEGNLALKDALAELKRLLFA